MPLALPPSDLASCPTDCLFLLRTAPCRMGLRRMDTLQMRPCHPTLPCRTHPAMAIPMETLPRNDALRTCLNPSGPIECRMASHNAWIHDSRLPQGNIRSNAPFPPARMALPDPRAPGHRCTTTSERSRSHRTRARCINHPAINIPVGRHRPLSASSPTTIILRVLLPREEWYRRGQETSGPCPCPHTQETMTTHKRRAGG